MTLVNCDRSKHNERVNASRHWRTRGAVLPQTERDVLDAAARTPVNGRALFNYVEYGRRICPSTWLCVARADKRGKLAIRRLLEVGDEEAALLAQSEIVASLRERCPTFFSGMLVEENQGEPNVSSASAASGQ